jgi:hypothetical protein
MAVHADMWAAWQVLRASPCDYIPCVDGLVPVGAAGSMVRR